MDSRLMERAGAAEANLVNQSFISFPPICCVVIGVSVTARLKHFSPICLDTHYAVHPSLAGQVLSSGVRILGIIVWLKLKNVENASPFLLMGTQSLQGVVGGHQDDYTNSMLSRWLAWPRHLLQKTCTCHTRRRVLLRV